MENYLTAIEKHIKRSVYPIGVIAGGFLIAQVYDHSNEKAWQLAVCAVVLIISGFIYFGVTGVSAVKQLTSTINPTWLKIVAAILVVIIYLSIFAAGFAASLSAHNKAFKSPSAGTAKSASL